MLPSIALILHSYLEKTSMWGEKKLSMVLLRVLQGSHVVSMKVEGFRVRFRV